MIFPNPVSTRAGDVGVTVKTGEEAKEYITLGKWNYESMSWKYYLDAESELSDVVTDSKATPMEWQVLEYSEDGKKALVLSRYVTAIYYTYPKSLTNKGVWKVQKRIYTFFTPFEKNLSL